MLHGVLQLQRWLLLPSLHKADSALYSRASRVLAARVADCQQQQHGQAGACKQQQQPQQEEQGVMHQAAAAVWVSPACVGR